LQGASTDWIDAVRRGGIHFVEQLRAALPR